MIEMCPLEQKFLAPPLGAKLNKRLLVLPEGGLSSAHIDENTHNVQPSTNIPSAPPMIGRSAHEDQIKDVALDVANSPFAYKNLGDSGTFV
ncbi:hypothetical protein Tco_0739625 [Tanacetum coccineum]